jgi:hypothetical protein
MRDQCLLRLLPVDDFTSLPDSSPLHIDTGCKQMNMKAIRHATSSPSAAILKCPAMRPRLVANNLAGQITPLHV